MMSTRPEWLREGAAPMPNALLASQNLHPPPRGENMAQKTKKITHWNFKSGWLSPQRHERSISTHLFGGGCFQGERLKVRHCLLFQHSLGSSRQP